MIVYWHRYRRHGLGLLALAVVSLFVLVGIYAPFLASSKPIAILYDGHLYFPLFRYLLYRGFYTTALDIFFNLMIFTVPLALLSRWLGKGAWMLALLVQIGGFAWILFSTPQNPAADPTLTRARLGQQPHTWADELRYMTPYAKLNLVLHEQRLRQQSASLASAARQADMMTPWQEEQKKNRERIEGYLQEGDKEQAAKIQDRLEWLDRQQTKIRFQLMPLLRPFHWEEAAGDQNLNPFVPWWELTRSGGKDLAAALIFGVRVSLIVGLLAIGIALAIGIPVGALAGYYGAWTDIAVSRLLEIWEAMPTFFMLLFIVAITQSKSIILVVLVIGLFGWTGFSRYIRGEFLKQRHLPYVEACRAMGFNDRYIIFRHILPNAIPPLLTLLPFAIMGAISTEAGLSFLGLGEAGSCSWGVLMDEGRRAFPGASYLLWPPAILLTVLLVAIALVGDALRDAIDPRLIVRS